MTDISIDALMCSADNYAHCYAFVGDDSMPIARQALKEALTAALSTVEPAEPDMRHPKIQTLIGQNARQNIRMSLVEELLEDPHMETTAMDMEYWDSLHDKLQEKLTAVSPIAAEIRQAVPGWVLAIKDYPGVRPTGSMRRYFEGAIEQTATLEKNIHLTCDAEGVYTMPTTNAMWCGFALGMRCADRIAAAPPQGDGK